MSNSKTKHSIEYPGYSLQRVLQIVQYGLVQTKNASVIRDLELHQQYHVLRRYL